MGRVYRKGKGSAYLEGGDLMGESRQRRRNRERAHREYSRNLNSHKQRAHQDFLYEQAQNRRWLHKRWQEREQNGLTKDQRGQLYLWFSHETIESQNAPPSKRQGMKLWSSTMKHLEALDAKREVAGAEQGVERQSLGDKPLGRVKDWFTTPGDERDLTKAMRGLGLTKPKNPKRQIRRLRKFLIKKEMREHGVNEVVASERVSFQAQALYQREKAAGPVEEAIEDLDLGNTDNDLALNGEEDGGEIGERDEDDEEVEGDDEDEETADEWEAEEEWKLRVQEAATRKVLVSQE